MNSKHSNPKNIIVVFTVYPIIFVVNMLLKLL